MFSYDFKLRIRHYFAFSFLCEEVDADALNTV